MLRKPENVSPSFVDRLRMRSSDFNGLNLMVSLSNHGQQTQDEVEPFQRLKPHGELVEP
jgi:hypothetical protein